MNGRAAKVARKAARETADAVAPVLDAAADHAFRLERRIDELERAQWYLQSLQRRHSTFMGRLRWFLGR